MHIQALTVFCYFDVQIPDERFDLQAKFDLLGDCLGWRYGWGVRTDEFKSFNSVIFVESTYLFSVGC